MENAIFKTLIYADIFDYPLKAYEIHKWLIGRKATLQQIENALGLLNQKLKVKSKKGYYFLIGRDKLVRKRKIITDQSYRFLIKAKLAVRLLRIIPWIKLIGVSGGLAMENADIKDDIDLFIITAENRLWISRLLILVLLSLTGQRRKVEAKNDNVAGKFCVNMLLEEDRLSQSNKDIYLAHEVLQMKVLWQKNNIYSKYLTDNEWVFKFLPNWIGSYIEPSLRGMPRPVVRFDESKTKRTILTKKDSHAPVGLGMRIENLARRFQLWYMKSPQGNERIEDGALYFHPNDTRERVLGEYKLKTKIF